MVGWGVYNWVLLAGRLVGRLVGFEVFLAADSEFHFGRLFRFILKDQQRF